MQRVNPGRAAKAGCKIKAMLEKSARSVLAMAVILGPATVSLCQTRPAPGAWVEARGVRIHVPLGWSYNDRLAAASGPISVNNFNGMYASGGLLPPAGAEIEITSLPAPPNLMEYIRKELRGAKIDSLQEMAAGDKSGIRATYFEEISQGASRKTVVSYIGHAGFLYKFYLSYWDGNRNEGALASLLDQVIKEAQLR